MIDIQDIRIDDTNWEIAVARSGVVTSHLLIDAINDMARETERRAKEFAPIGKGFNPGDVPGTLKRHGVVRTDAHFAEEAGGGVAGETVSTAHAIGGGFSVKGAGGRFTRAEKNFLPGHVFTGGGGLGRRIVSAMVTLNPLVPHARWVHEGTGVYGPHHTPIVPRVAPYLTFRWHGRRFEKKSVRGQKPQSFLTEAYEYVNNVYAPAKVSELRAELSAEL